MRQAEMTGENDSGTSAIRFLLMTGLRRMEALALARGWIDVHTQCIRFPDTKSGAQLRPIGRDAVELFKSLPVADGNSWVFPAKRGKRHYVGVPKVLRRLCQELVWKV